MISLWCSIGNVHGHPLNYVVFSTKALQQYDIIDLILSKRAENVPEQLLDLEK